MGTTLTGTTPQDTYDSLIKVTDNGPLSGTAKYLSDGLGNDSALAVSTSGVGIGTTSLFADLQVNKASDVTLALSNSTAVTSGNRGNLVFYNSAVSTVALIKATAVTDNVGTQLEFYTRPAAGSLAQTMTIASTGNVGIGISAPTTKLEVVIDNAVTNDSTNALNITHTSSGTTANGFGVGLGFRLENSTYGVINEVGSIEVVETDQVNLNDAMVFYTKSNNVLTEKVRIIPSGGITFNGDTAAANALDDYEEGTFTCAVNVGSGSVTVDTTVNQGRYTKIGNVVSAQGRMKLTAVSSPSGNWSIDLPFTVASYNANGANEGVGSCVASNIDFGTNTMISAMPDRGSALCFFIACGDNSASIQLNGTHLSATSDLYFQTTYITA